MSFGLGGGASDTGACDLRDHRAVTLVLDRRVDARLERGRTALRRRAPQAEAHRADERHALGAGVAPDHVRLHVEGVSGPARRPRRRTARDRTATQLVHDLALAVLTRHPASGLTVRGQVGGRALLHAASSPRSRCPSHRVLAQRLLQELAALGAGATSPCRSGSPSPRRSPCTRAPRCPTAPRARRNSSGSASSARCTSASTSGVSACVSGSRIARIVVAPTHAIGERLGVRPLEDVSLEAAAAVAVDERVGQDPEQPGLEVRARLELIAGAHRLDDGVLDQILGLGGAPRHPAAHAVKRVEMTEELDLEGVGAADRRRWRTARSCATDAGFLLKKNGMGSPGNRGAPRRYSSLHPLPPRDPRPRLFLRAGAASGAEPRPRCSPRRRDAGASPPARQRAATGA